MTTKQILSILNVLAWIAFISLCIKSGSLLINLIWTLYVNENAAGNILTDIDFSKLYKYSRISFAEILSLLIFLSGFQAYLFYLTTKLFEKINLENPFTEIVSKLILKISYIIFGIGITNIFVSNYSKRLIKKGIELPEIHEYISSYSASEFFFLAGIIFVIAQIFKRGIELQNENDFTI